MLYIYILYEQFFSLDFEGKSSHEEIMYAK